MPRPTLREVLARLEGFELSHQAGHDREGHLVLQLRLRDDEENPLPAPPAGGAEEPAVEPAQPVPPATTAWEAVLPRAVPEDASELPVAVSSLVGRLPAVAGRLGPADRILRAARLGASDRAVANGDAAVQRPSGQLGLATRVYVVLVDQHDEGPWICRLRRDYVAAVGDPFAPGSVSRAFASDSEAIAYHWGSGAEPVLPAPWPSQA